MILYASAGDSITDAVNQVAKSLRYPVLILALLALAVVAYELGRLAVEAWKRSQRPKTPFEETARQALGQARAGDGAGAQATLKAYSYGNALQKAAVGTLFATNPIDAQRAVIDYDLYVSKRLDRVRLLVRAGPALGLMGTLIPLAPALAALGKGQPQVLATELQSAFAITVVGVAVGLIAFTVALVRERFYTKDLADLEYLREVRGDAAVLIPASAAQPAGASPARQTSTVQPAASQVSAEDTVAIPAPVASKPSQPVSVPKPEPAAPAVTPPPAVTPTPAVPATPGVTSAPVPPAAPAAPGVPPVADEKKKKFGIRKKSSGDAADAAPPAFPPPPPATGFQNSAPEDKKKDE